MSELQKDFSSVGFSSFGVVLESGARYFRENRVFDVPRGL